MKNNPEYGGTKKHVKTHTPPWDSQDNINLKISTRSGRLLPQNKLKRIINEIIN